MGFTDTIKDWQYRHRQFVKRVHAFRIPLSPMGIKVAKVFYFSVPVIGGYYIMEWAKSRAKDEIGWVETGKDERHKVMASMRIDPTKREEELARIERQNDRLQSYLSSLKKP